jgi:hypothetical protein
MAYISFPIEATPDEILDAAYDYIKTRAPEWRENDGNLDTWILQSMSLEAADLRELALDVPDTIFRYYGELVGIPPIDSTAATVNSTWTMIDNLGYTVPAGTQVGVRNAAGDLVPFVTTIDTTIPPGSTTTAAGAVVLQAATPGIDSSGLGGNGVAATLLDTLAYVASVVLTAVTSGGVDAETASEYNDRLSTQLQLLTNRPILANDFAILAQQVPGVFRALALDGYNPADQTSNNQRMIAVAAVDEQGNAVSSTVKGQVDALLQANREVNFIVNLIDPTYTTIQVAVTVKSLSNIDPTLLSQNVTAVIQNYLSPATWGRDAGSQDPQTWIQTGVLRYNELITAISNIGGVDYVVDLQIGPQGGALVRTDVNLGVPASLTRAGTISPTLT